MFSWDVTEEVDAKINLTSYSASKLKLAVKSPVTCHMDEIWPKTRLLCRKNMLCLFINCRFLDKVRKKDELRFGIDFR